MAWAASPEAIACCPSPTRRRTRASMPMAMYAVRSMVSHCKIAAPVEGDSVDEMVAVMLA